jgi:hypothetical protein
VAVDLLVFIRILVFLMAYVGCDFFLPRKRLVAGRAAEVSAIGAAPLTQEQLKVASFCSQLDADDEDDDNEGDDDVVDKDDDDVDEDDGLAEGLLEVARTEARSRAQRSVRAGGGQRTSPPHLPTAGWGGAMATRTPKKRDGRSLWGWTSRSEGGRRQRR